MSFSSGSNSSRSSIDAAHKPLNEPWEGESKIVIGIDIGTTQSGVAVAFLETGDPPKIHRVVKWPGQEERDQQGKIPTVVWYDKNKKAVSFGAEALSHLAEEQAEDNDWVLARHFKLHLHPDHMRVGHGLKLDDLPQGVTLRQIYADFLGYLLRHTQTFFEDRIIDGRRIWQKYSSTKEIVIAHPNGWSLREQSFLREAAIDAGLVDHGQASSNIRFVTEAEASVHFCIHHTNIGNRLQPGSNFVICDAGGSTTDTVVYTLASARPTLKLQEKQASACVQAGGIFVDATVQDYLCKTLAGAGYCEADVEDYSKTGFKDFESFSKRQFADESKEYSIQIGRSRLNDAGLRIRRGHMILPGTVMKSFFETCCKDIFTSVDQQLQGVPVSHILLVGGFGDSPFLRSEFRRRYEHQDCQVTLTNDSTSKAVAEGAVIWNILSSVVSRAPRYAFGVKCNEKYNPLIPEHQGRPTFMHPDGTLRARGRWIPIVEKGIPLDVQATCRHAFSRAYFRSNPKLESFHTSLIAYAGDSPPFWATENQGTLLLDGFRRVCRISADLSKLSGALKRHTGRTGTTYWRLDFDVCIRFGGTELEAYLEWEEGGITRTGPVSIVPDDPTES
ncbi:unnamed protein product [Rhizoctonia solani]|uniref:Heat shock 70 kDa protein 12A n=1 Tax=Rhizoctonia solani TaxID=456999 RepID=A0A8H2WMB0_9AGAM|nr:unnamed protein product [Rhizoctonia solani]